MNDAEQVSQALAELWDIVKCRCDEAYTGRGLHDPDCECDSTDALQIVADRIEALTEQLTAAQHDADEADAYAWELEQKLGHYKKEVVDTAEANEADATRRADALEAKLAKAVEALEFYADEDHYTTTYEDMSCECCTDIYEPVMRDEGEIARATLATLKGDKP